MRPVIHGGDIYQNKVELDFSVNINPFGIPEKVKEAMRQSLECCEQYPDIHHAKLIREIGKRHAFPENQILCGNGASELFVAIVHAIRPKKIMIPVPSFYGYEKAAGVTEAEVSYYEMAEADGFRLTETILPELKEDVDLLFLANPNNPVGNTIDEPLLEKICRQCKKMQITVVLDECFLEFTEKKSFFETHSFLEYPNVILVKAFTKLYAIPGVRLGYACCGDQNLCGHILNQLPEWNISAIAEAAGLAALKETGYCSRSIAYIRKERDFLRKELEQAGISVFPGEADFLLLKTDRPLYEELLKRNILIRDCSNYRGLQKGYYRIAVRKREENERLIWAILNSREEKRTGKDEMETIEYVRPQDIEKRSFAIITKELEEKGITLPKSQELVTKRAIHTSADFDYARTMTFSENAVAVAKELIRNGADIVTDTNMALAGINKKELAKYGGTAHCFMAEEEVAKIAKERGVTRAVVSMEKAAQIKKPVIFAIGNAPTALIELYEMIQSGSYQPAFIIGVPVGFVNVEAAKELILKTDVPHIINRGRKGGSNVAAAICNALLYELRDHI